MSSHFRWTQPIFPVYLDQAWNKMHSRAQHMFNCYILASCNKHGLTDKDISWFWLRVSKRFVCAFIPYHIQGKSSNLLANIYHIHIPPRLGVNRRSAWLGNDSETHPRGYIHLWDGWDDRGTPLSSPIACEKKPSSYLGIGEWNLWNDI